jgi:hypothetical protein
VSDRDTVLDNLEKDTKSTGINFGCSRVVAMDMRAFVSPLAKDYSVHDMQGDLVNPIIFGYDLGGLRHKSWAFSWVTLGL